jgi:hypothetical protein
MESKYLQKRFKSHSQYTYFQEFNQKRYIIWAKKHEGNVTLVPSGYVIIAVILLMHLGKVRQSRTAVYIMVKGHIHVY